MEAFPLHWPFGYKRTVSKKRSAFKKTMAEAQKALHDEIRKLGGRELIVSTNIPVRKDGFFHNDWNKKNISDPGVAIYFKFKGKDVSMCCDQYENVWENTYALAKGIEALRGMDRWGVSEFIDRAFTGFTQIEGIKVRSWYEILEVDRICTVDQVKTNYRRLARLYHPDLNEHYKGDDSKIKEINNAFEAAKTIMGFN